MSGKLHKTKGIVLRTVKYGETSVISTIYTELFGLQSYLVNGVRTTSGRGGGKAGYFQPSAMLDLVVYHNEMKQLNRLREFKWAVLFRHIFSDVPKNAVAMFMIELLSKCLKQPEGNSDLYHFCEDALMHLDESNNTTMANFPLFFALHLTGFFGFKPHDKQTHAHGTGNLFFDLKEGKFSFIKPDHPHFLEGRPAEVTHELLKVMQPEELEEFKLNHDFRRQLLSAFVDFYALHIHDFGKLKTLPVLREVLA
jgi:DNA repair protein RecO (recombination protein O)